MKDYDCIYRFLGDCPNCIKDDKNLQCKKYYPCHIILGACIVEGRETASILIEKLKDEIT
jgi:hypothetical protein